ncbi:MAG: hypothetical protein DCC68_26405 [Planctomycetota bacterium]|nr:MAG: hypothetical protein DCC68_26405 [Planctomycetota bacterium]
MLHATVTAPTFTDQIVDTNVTYTYEIAAVNPSNMESTPSTAVSARVLVVASALPRDGSTVRLRFNSVVAVASAENLANYTVPGLDVLDASLEAGGNSVLLTTSPHTIGQPYRIVVNGVTSTTGTLIQPDSQTVFVAGLAPGLYAEYFNDPVTSAQPNTDSLLPENLVATRVDPRIDTGPSGMNWPATGSPIPDTVHNDYFSVRWTGRLGSLAAGEYRISIQASDGIRVWIWPLGESRPQTPLIDRWMNSSFNTFTAPTTLAGDTSYNLQVEYYETTGSASAFVRWTLPGQVSSAVIPTSQLSLPVDLETSAPQVTDVFGASAHWTPAFIDHLRTQGLGDGGVAVPLGGTSSVLPWSNLNQIRVRFDSDVIVGADDLTVGGVNVASYGIVGFDYDYATLTATWTLAEPIAFDRATVALAPTVTDLAYNSIAGPLSSVVRVATGDVTGDGTIDLADRTSGLAAQFTSIGHANYLASRDLTGDGVINLSDLVILQQRFGETLPAAGPSAAASAVLVHRVVADAERTTSARPIRASRVATAQRAVAAIDRTIGQETNAVAEGTSKLTAHRARRIARAAVDAVWDGAGFGA